MDWFLYGSDLRLERVKSINITQILYESVSRLWNQISLFIKQFKLTKFWRKILDIFFLMSVLDYLFGLIHLVRTQNFPKISFFVLPDTCTCAYQGVRNISFLKNFAYMLHEWSFSVGAHGYTQLLLLNRSYSFSSKNYWFLTS